MTFVVTANPPTATAESPVINDGWWPDIDLQQLRADCRLDNTVTAPRLRRAVVDAVAGINDELTAWQSAQWAAGHATLSAVPAPQIDGKSVKLAQYLRAVGAAVQADLAEAYRDMSTLPEGANKEGRVLAALDVRQDAFRRQLRWALADLQGRRRVIAELM